MCASFFFNFQIWQTSLQQTITSYVPVFSSISILATQSAISYHLTCAVFFKFQFKDNIPEQSFCSLRLTLDANLRFVGVVADVDIEVVGDVADVEIDDVGAVADVDIEVIGDVEIDVVGVVADVDIARC